MAPRTTLQVLLALSLILVPIWAPALGVTGTEYQYQSAAITVDNDTIALNDSDYFGGPTTEIGCLSSRVTVETDRGCYLESQLRNQSVAINYPGLESFSGEARVTRPKYVVFGTEGVVYRRTVRYDSGTQSHIFGLTQVEPETALSEVAVPSETAPASVREALRTGSARRENSVGDPGQGRIYRHAGGYFVVHETTRQGLVPKPAVERGLTVLTVLSGAGLLFVSARQSGRPRREH